MQVFSSRTIYLTRRSDTCENKQLYYLVKFVKEKFK